eukprot:3513542-Prymnesium_polylepis.1
MARSRVRSVAKGLAFELRHGTRLSPTGSTPCSTQINEPPHPDRPTYPSGPTDTPTHRTARALPLTLPPLVAA